MNKSRIITKTLLIVFSLFFFSGTALTAEKTTIVGIVQSIDLDSQTVVVKTYTGKTLTITVEDELTLKKLKTRRIRVEDEVKVRYIQQDGKNLATYFKKPAGC